MKIAITGGTGFVGGHLARRLVADNQEVVLIARGQDHRDTKIFKLEHSQFFGELYALLPKAFKAFWSQRGKRDEPFHHQCL